MIAVAPSQFMYNYYTVSLVHLSLNVERHRLLPSVDRKEPGVVAKGLMGPLAEERKMDTSLPES